MLTQQPEFANETEHISEKRERAHRHLSTVIYLLENVIESLEMPQSFRFYRNILDYMFCFQEVIAKFVKVYLDYKMNSVSRILSDEKEIKPKTIAICKLMIAMSKYIKMRIDFQLKQNMPALDMLHSIFGCKVNWRIQEYLVHIEYWVKKMSPQERQRYQLF